VLYCEIHNSCTHKFWTLHLVRSWSLAHFGAACVGIRAVTVIPCPGAMLVSFPLSRRARSRTPKILSDPPVLRALWRNQSRWSRTGARGVLYVPFADRKGIDSYAVTKYAVPANIRTDGSHHACSIPLFAPQIGIAMPLDICTDAQTHKHDVTKKWPIRDSCKTKQPGFVKPGRK